MTQFLAEIYLPCVGPDGLRRAGAAAQALAQSGLPVRHVHSIYVPDDETCFLLFEAPSEAAARAAVDWAQLICNRVVEAHGAHVEEDVR